MSSLSPSKLVKTLKFHRHECWGGDQFAFTLLPNMCPQYRRRMGSWLELAIRNGKCNLQAAMVILDAFGWVFHTVDDRRYFFTTPNGQSVSCSRTEVQTVALGLLITWQQSPEYVKTFTDYYEGKLEEEAAWKTAPAF